MCIEWNWLKSDIICLQNCSSVIKKQNKKKHNTFGSGLQISMAQQGCEIHPTPQLSSCFFFPKTLMPVIITAEAQAMDQEQWVKQQAPSQRKALSNASPPPSQPHFPPPPPEKNLISYLPSAILSEQRVYQSVSSVWSFFYSSPISH